MQRLLGLEFSSAVKYCASLAGVRTERCSPADLRRARAQQDRERHEREEQERSWRERWREALSALRDAQGDVLTVKALYQFDPDQRDPWVATFLADIGDPYLREIVAEQRLDAIERAWRATRDGGRRAVA